MQGHLQAGQAGQPLHAAGSRQEADENLRQAQLGRAVVRQDPVMTGQGQLQAAAEGQTMDGGHKGLAAGLDPPQ